MSENKKLALITGGTSGIGFGAALKLAPTHHLALTFASDEAKAHKALAAIKEKFPETQVKLFQQFLSAPADADALWSRVLEEHGKQAPSILVNSAGRLADGLFLQQDFTKFASVVQEHLIVTMAISQHAVKAMYKAKWGRIVNLSSISASYAKRGQANYAAAKAGIEGFTRTLALEVAHRGVTVNAIAPGLIETPMTQDLLAKIDSSDRNLKARIPAGRPGKLEEAGALIAFLCSEDAAYITGTTITIDGGRSLGDPES